MGKTYYLNKVIISDDHSNEQVQLSETVSNFEPLNPEP